MNSLIYQELTVDSISNLTNFLQESNGINPRISSGSFNRGSSVEPNRQKAISSVKLIKPVHRICRLRPVKRNHDDWWPNPPNMVNAD